MVVALFCCTAKYVRSSVVQCNVTEVNMFCVYSEVFAINLQRSVEQTGLSVQRAWQPQGQLG